MTAAKKELCFLPLGGAGEIGMNLNLYGFGAAGDEDWVMVDLGVTFGSGAPGIDVIMPDPAFIEERRDRLLGLVLTHAHEDHLGAVPYLWPRLECPVYATPFTASVLRRKLAEVETLATRSDERSLLWQDIVSRNEDADLAQVAIDLTRQKMVLEASYSVFAQLSKLSLLSYL